jgi:hypothetical protein
LLKEALVSFVPIYLPDGSLGIDWYVTDEKQLRGVERVSESWVRHEVGPRRDVGFRRLDNLGASLPPGPPPSQR